MKIVVNGSEKVLERSYSIAELIENYSLDERRIIALKNDTVIKQEQYASVILTGGERIELLSIVGGG